MQPNVLFFTFAGVGFNFVLYFVDNLLKYSISLLSTPKNVQSISRNLKQIQKATGSIHSPKDQNDTDSGKAQSSYGKYIPGRMVMGLILAAIFAHHQHKKWLFVSDQSKAFSFRNYASAMLKPLPKKALLLINYDMLWTSVRYMQQCEGYRKDITSINLSMMTYEWFEHKRALLPQILFPALFHAAPSNPYVKARRAFTMKNLLDANFGRVRIFLGGKLSFADPELDQKYTLIPTGLASEFKLGTMKPNATSYKRLNIFSWEV